MYINHINVYISYRLDKFYPSHSCLPGSIRQLYIVESEEARDNKISLLESKEGTYLCIYIY